MTRAGTGVRVAAVAVVVLGLVAVVALASGAGRPAAGGGTTNLVGVQDAKDVFYTALLTVYALVLVPLVAYLVGRSRVRSFEAPKVWDFRSLAGFLLLAGALAFLVLNRPDGLRRQFEEWRLSRLQERLERVPGGAEGAAASLEPEFRWWVAAAILAVSAAAVAVYLVWSRTGRARPEALPERLADELAEAVDASLIDLEAETEPRRAVIAAYAQMERVLAARGVGRRPHEVPFEYLGRVLRELAVRPAAVLALTELFERARFSRHEIDASMRLEAAEALAAVRDDLRVAA